MLKECGAAINGINLTKVEAAAYTDLVRQRAKGTIDSPVREMLLASNPEFIKLPAQEFAKGFAKGFVGKFSTKGHKKSKGVEFSFSYPLSWKREEGERPNIIQKWTSDGGHGMDVFLISVTKLPEVPTQAEVTEFFGESGAKEMIPDGGVFLRFSSGKIERLPLGMLHYTSSSQRLDATIKMRAVMYYFIAGDSLIMMQFMCRTSEDTDASREGRFTLLEPLFKSILNSMV